jgi:hypothetical protein
VDLRLAFEGASETSRKKSFSSSWNAPAPAARRAGRVLHVDQQEGALLAPRLDVAAGQQVLERAEAQQAAISNDSCRSPTWHAKDEERETTVDVEEGIGRAPDRSAHHAGRRR